MAKEIKSGIISSKPILVDQRVAEELATITVPSEEAALTITIWCHTIHFRCIT